MAYFLDDELDELQEYSYTRNGIHKLIQQAETGDVHAAFLLGVYFNLKNLQDLADTYFEIAAASGNEKAKYILSLDPY